MDLDFKARISTCVKTLNTHTFELAVSRFNAHAILTKLVVIQPGIRPHIGSADGNETHARLGQNAGFALEVDVALVGKDPCARRQLDQQFMNGSELMLTSGQEVKGDWQTLRRADQMQAPTKELLVLGRTVATIVPPAHLAAGRGAHSLADRDGHTIDHNDPLRAKTPA